MSMIKDMSDDVLAAKIDSEGIEYFFTSYIGLDNIQDTRLREAAERFVEAYQDIEELLEEIMRDY